MDALAAPAVVASTTSTLTDLGHLAPMMVVALWSLLLLVTDAYAAPGLRAFQRRLALVGVGIAACLLGLQFGTPAYDAGVPVFSGFLVVDQFSLLLDLGLLAICAGTMLFCGDYARTQRFEYGEQEALIFIAAFGIMILFHANDLLALFLGIETMSIGVYVLAGARWNTKHSPEAALKYFLMGAFASALLLMGIALLYGATGTFSLPELATEVQGVFHRWRASQDDLLMTLNGQGGGPARDAAIIGFAPAALLIPGVFLVLAALLFKISAVPFHMWTPDAYDGAPTPTTAFMAAAVKLGGFAALLKLMVGVFHLRTMVVEPYGWTSPVAIVALLTMTVGNLAAVTQTNVKRMLAFSSIAHVGYALIGVVAAASFYGRAATAGNSELANWALVTGDFAVASVLYYLLTYAVATMGCFACVAWFGGYRSEGLNTHQWSGLAQRNPGVAFGMTICLLSLMGMPPTAGFIGKLSVFRVAFENDNYGLRLLVIAALINSVIGAYYYLRLIVAMYFRPRPDVEVPVMESPGARAVVAVSALACVVAGIGADSLMRGSELASAGFAYSAGSEARGERVKKLRARWEDASDGVEGLPAAADAKAIEKDDETPPAEKQPLAAAAVVPSDDPGHPP